MVGIDTLGGCKGGLCSLSPFFLCHAAVKVWWGWADPERHFQLVTEHIRAVRRLQELTFSTVVVIVERNLGFEAEHLQRGLCHLEGVRFYHDQQANRVGVLTTENVKLGAMTLTNIMLREKRVHVLPDTQFVSATVTQTKVKLREQLQIYSFQFKQPDSVFQKSRYALSGKVGGLKDDVVICLQLGIYWTETGRLVFGTDTD